MGFFVLVFLLYGLRVIRVVGIFLEVSTEVGMRLQLRLLLFIVSYVCTATLHLGLKGNMTIGRSVTAEAKAKASA
mgnify:CR=1 FL=1